MFSFSDMNLFLAIARTGSFTAAAKKLHTTQSAVSRRLVQLEREVNPSIAQRLAQMGHQVEIVNSNLDMGRGQIIWRTGEGTLAGGTEPQADGSLAAW